MVLHTQRTLVIQKYKDFDIIDVGDGRREYAPIRIAMDERVDRFNDEAMELSKKQIDEVVASCRKRLGKPKTYTGNFVPHNNKQGQSCSPSQPQQPSYCITNAITVE